MPDKDSRPKPLNARPEAGYPRLVDHRYERRSFLKKILLSVGVLSIGGGKSLLVGCAESHAPRPANDNHLYTAGAGGSFEPPLNLGGRGPEPQYPDPYDPPPASDAGVDARRLGQTDAGPADAGRDAAPPKVDPEWPLAGEMVEPEFHAVRLPAEGFRYLYLGMDGELKFGISFITYDAGLADFYRRIGEDPAAESELFTLVNRLLYEYTCDTLDVGRVEVDLVPLLEEYYREQTGVQGATIEIASLEVDSCRFMPMGGGLPAPDY